MKKKVLAASLFLMLCGPVYSDTLSPERIFDSPSLDGEPIRGLKISPDGSRVTYLKGKDTDYEQLDLWEYNIASNASRMLFDSKTLHSGDEKLSDEEQARRERLRLAGSGIVSYEWSKDGKALFFPLAGDVYYWRVGEAKAKRVVATPEFETDVKFSPKGNYLSFIREQNLYVLDLSSGRETALTKDGGGLIKYGMAEFVAQEEMDRMTGYWWSEDESKIAFTRVDESPVEEVTRSEIYAEDIQLVKQRYPFAGSKNVEIGLAIISLKDKELRWVDLGENKDFYLPRVEWTQDSELLTYQWQSRDQKSLKLSTVSWPSMEQNTLLTESSKTWLNLHDDLRFLKDGKHFIWASERDGFKHLYLYDLKGNQVSQITSGDWVVDELEHVDEKSGIVYFSGRKDTPIERHLYAAPLKGGEIKTISSRSGHHDITFAKDGSSYVDDFSTATTPPQVSLHKAQGEHLKWLAENKLDKNHPLFPYLKDWITPEFGSFRTQDEALLYYRMFKPRDFDETKKYPVIVYLYGGPGAQRVVNSWDRLLPQYMAQQGYVVFTLDNRGSHQRGKAFEDPIYQAMGEIEVQDQVEGVKFLRKFPWVDKDKVGVHGDSYGGYMSLMTMFKAPEYFKAGAAGAPVTDWMLYDTHYTERYMGHPNEAKEAYEKSSVFPYATNLKGSLLIYHGMADDNVLFKNSTKLYKLLQDNNIPFMMMDYPGKKHRFTGKKTSMHRLNTIKIFFDMQFKRD